MNPAHLTPPTDQETFLSEYIPTLIYQYNLAFEQDDSERNGEAQKIAQSSYKNVKIKLSSGEILQL